MKRDCDFRRKAFQRRLASPAQLPDCGREFGRQKLPPRMAVDLDIVLFVCRYLCHSVPNSVRFLMTSIKRVEASAATQAATGITHYVFDDPPFWLEGFRAQRRGDFDASCLERR